LPASQKFGNRWRENGFFDYQIDKTRNPNMDVTTLLPVLALFTLLAVAVFALVSKKKTEERMDDPTVPKSTLAKDGPQGGVDLLLPPDQQGHNNPNVKPVLD